MGRKGEKGSGEQTETFAYPSWLNEFRETGDLGKQNASFTVAVSVT